MITNDMDNYLKTYWGKKPRSILRKELGLTDGELLWHAGRLVLSLTIIPVRSQDTLIIHSDGTVHIPKKIAIEAGLVKGMRVQFELESSKPLEKTIKMRIIEPEKPQVGTQIEEEK